LENVVRFGKLLIVITSNVMFLEVDPHLQVHALSRSVAFRRARSLVYFESQ